MSLEERRILSKNDIERIEATYRPLERAEARARELIDVVPKSPLFVAIAGTQLEFDSYEMKEGE